MKNIVCFGDSITQCAGLAENHRWTAGLAFSLETKFPGKYDVFNRGIGGNTTALALDRIQTDVLPLLPAIVLIEFGINDAYVYPWCKTPRVGLNDFRMNLEEIIRQVNDNGGCSVLIANHPVTERLDQHPQGNGLPLAHNLRPYNDAIRNVAASLALEVWDFPEILKRHGIPASKLLAEDGVHLSGIGNQTYGKLAYEQFTERTAWRPAVTDLGDRHQEIPENQAKCP